MGRPAWKGCIVTYLGIVRDGRIELNEQLVVPDGQPVRVSVELLPEEPRLNSPAAILDAMRSPPHVDPADVDAMEREIAAGALPMKEGGIFDPPD